MTPAHRVGEQTVEDLLTADLTLTRGIITLALESWPEVQSGDEDVQDSQIDSKWQSISTGRAQ